MADKIKKFFAKKKADVRFKKAGPGHKLSADSSNTGSSSKSSDSDTRHYKAAPRDEPSLEARLAAEAALARLGGHKGAPAFNTSLAAIQAQVKRELEAERQAHEIEESTKQATDSKDLSREVEASPHLATQGVYFRCPMVSEEVLSKQEWKLKIKQFLNEQLAEERGLTACLMIHSCNTRDKVEACVEMLSKYLENIVAHPNEEKYQRIRMSNRLFCDRVKPVDGAMDFLQAAGFVEETVNGDNGPDQFLVYHEENMEHPESLEILLDALQTAEPVALELDRGLQILLPSQASRRTELPPAFYALSPDDIKKEQQLRTETIEKAQMLRTKAMREKEEMRELRKYRFALIRVRFPDGIYLQGTFGVYEKLSEVYDFVRSALEDEVSPFTLISPTGVRLKNDTEKSLFELRLVPATVMTFEWESGVESSMFLKPGLMLLLQDI